MVKRLKTLFKRLFDYRVIGEYYDNDGKGHLTKKYMKKYFLRKNYNY